MTDHSHIPVQCFHVVQRHHGPSPELQVAGIQQLQEGCLENSLNRLQRHIHQWILEDYHLNSVQLD